VVNNDAAVRDAFAFALRLEGCAPLLYADAAALLADMPPRDSGCLILQEPGGLELLRGLRAHGVAAPAILLAGRLTPALRRRAAEAGVWQVLEKPILDRALLQAVAAVLAGAPPPAQTPAT